MSSSKIHQQAIALSSIGRGASMGVISGPAYHYGRWSGGNPTTTQRVRAKVSVTDASRVRREGNVIKIAVPTQSGEPCEIHAIDVGQFTIFYICCGGHCAPLPIAIEPMPGSGSRPQRPSSLAAPGAAGPNCWIGVGHNNVVTLCCDVGDDTHCAPLPITFGPLPNAYRHEITHQTLRHGNPGSLTAPCPPGQTFVNGRCVAQFHPPFVFQAANDDTPPWYNREAPPWQTALIANGGPQKNCFYLVVDDFRLYRCCSGKCTEIFLDGSEGPTTWNVPTGAIDVTAQARAIQVGPQLRMGVRYGGAPMPTQRVSMLQPVRNPPRTKPRTYRNPIFAATATTGTSQAAADCSNPNTPASACKWICLPMPSPNDPHDEHCVRVPKSAQLRGAFFTTAPDVAPTIRERIAARYRGW